jgi:hypothetical protein
MNKTLKSHIHPPTPHARTHTHTRVAGGKDSVAPLAALSGCEKSAGVDSVDVALSLVFSAGVLGGLRPLLFHT